MEKLASEAVALAKKEKLEVCSAVLALPGVVATSTNQVFIAPNLGWRDTSLGDRLEPSGLPFSIENNANAAAMAELGTNATTSENFVHVTLGVGVGAGVISSGKLFRGARGFGAELGHITVDPQGPLCQCGNRGCLETLVGTDAVLATARRRIPRFPRGGSPDDAMAALAERARRGEKDALAVVEGVARWLAIGLASYANLFDPELIILGGYGAVLGPSLLPYLTPQLERAVLGARFAPIVVRPTLVMGDATLVGAALSALEPVFEDPARFQLGARPGSE